VILVTRGQEVIDFDVSELSGTWTPSLLLKKCAVLARLLLSSRNALYWHGRVVNF
jgi:hypothetical protein